MICPDISEMPAEEDPAAMEGRDSRSPQQFCLRWNNYQNNLTNCFDMLLQSQAFTDVTLACEGKSLKAHKVVLIACSPYFQELLMENPCQHPIIIIKDIKYCDLKAAVDFMYRGEINVSQEQISALLKVADTLKIRGLADVGGEVGGAALGRGSKRAAAEPLERSPAQQRRLSEEEAPGSASAGPATPPPPDTPDRAPPHPHHDDVDIRPGIAEMIREEERARMMENRQPWLVQPSTSAGLTAEYSQVLKPRAPRWTEAQLQEAIQAVISQQMKFTQAATYYAIPKGTLYDNILGKSKRMAVLDEVSLSASEERAVVEFCCETNASPYNRRTKKSLKSVLAFVEKLKKDEDPNFSFVGLTGFRWWWAFCKKHTIVSL